MEAFKSIRWKLSAMFALFISLLITIIGAIHIGSMMYNGKLDFEGAMNSVFSEEFIKELSTVAENVDYTVENSNSDNVTIASIETNNVQTMYNLVLKHSGELGLNSSRFMCILDESGSPIYSTNETVLNDGIEKTASVISAINGNIGMSSSLIQKHSDFALSINTTKNVIYIKDTGDILYRNLLDILFLYLRALIISLLLSLIIGWYLARSVTVPLANLNEWAKKLADGNLDAKVEVTGNDELSELSDSLMLMAHNLDATSIEATSEKIKLETILQTMTDGLLAFDTEGELIHYNEEAKRILGRNYLDDIKFDSFFKEINVNITIGDLLYMDQEGDVEREAVLDKEKFIALNFKTFTLNTKIAGIVVVLHDTTKQEKLELSRRAFVADVSHELRTPITTIKSYAETLLDNSDEGELYYKFVSVIASESDRMARLISDLLTLSSLDNKTATYKMPEEIDIRKMVETIVDHMAITAKNKGQLLAYNPINDCPTIIGDKDALERVIINIIGNAIKYTQDGGEINVYTSKVYNDVCIKVTDNGIGIPEENLPQIFDRFYRVDKARSRDTGGTGLGLAIAKQTIESQFKGKIKISSELGKGTEVSITIPVNSN